MSRKLSILMVVALLVSAFSVFGASVALAGTAAAGTGPGDALPVPAGAQTLSVGQRVWYGFQYTGDKSQIVADMNATPGGSASFAVWSQADVQNWQRTGKETPVGRGSSNKDFGGDLVWVGNFNQSGVYYIVVDQTGGSPATITLKVTGASVSGIAAPAAVTAAPAAVTAAPAAATSVTAAPAAATPVATPAATPVAAAPAAASAKSGTGPGDALPVPAGAQTLSVGQRVWYGFQYTGDKSQIIADMNATPGGSASFAVWSQADVQNWQRTGKETPVGRGSSNKDFGGDLVWVGNFNQSGVYYIVVDQTGGSPATITLKVTGASVSGIAAPAAVTAAPAAVTAAPAAATAVTAAPAAATPAATPAAAAAPTTVAVKGGTGPENALPAPSAATVAVGQRVWYMFQYGGDKSQIVVDMNATPGGSASFAVWSQADVQNWQRTGKETPVGRGSSNNNYGGDLVWTGHFNQSGVYYIVVDQAGGSAATIVLKVTGSAVSGLGK